MGRRLMMLLAWVAATALAATVAWAAVGTVGHGAGPTGTAVLSQAEVAAALDARRAAAASAVATAGPTTPPGDPTASPTPTPDVSATPAPDPSAAPTSAPITPAPTKVARTWVVDGGTVSASCSGGAIAFEYATPSDGWAYEVKNRGPEALEVELASERGETTVRAQCVAGVPEMSTTSDGAEAGHDGAGED